MASTTRPWVSQISWPVRTSVDTVANFTGSSSIRVWPIAASR